MSSSQFGVQPSRLGQINASGDVDALFLKVFSGEVLTTFEENNLMMPLHRVRTITSGKTAQFPTTGVAAAAYHTPGESLFHQTVTNTISGAQGSEALAQTNANKYLSQIKHAERTISIDGVLTASAFMSDIDEAKNHYDVRSIYSTEIGRQLAYAADRNLIRTVIAGARATTGRFGATLAGGDDQFGGAKVNLGDNTDASANEVGITTGKVETNGAAPSDATGDSLLQGLFLAAELFDQKNVPSEGRVCLLPPSQYYKLVKENQDAINRDKNPEGNLGSIVSGTVTSVAGITILKSNHVPSGAAQASEIHADAAINNDVFGSGGTGYGNADFSDTVGIVFQTEGIGTVKLMDLSMESEYYMDRLGTLMMAKYAMGHGVLREECCIELMLDAG
jgi:hypothetical protein